MPEPDPLVLEDVAEQVDGGNRFQVLGYEQVNRLHRLMDTEVPIHGRGNFPTLQIKLRELVQVVRTKLKEDCINVRDIRLNGGAASFILGNETSEVSHRRHAEFVTRCCRQLAPFPSVPPFSLLIKSAGG